MTVLAGIAAGLGAEACRRSETERIVVTEHVIALPMWPSALDGFRVIVASDMHVHPNAKAPGRRETRLGRILGSLDGDILVVPGDAANTRDAARIAAGIIEMARPRYGTFITFGNGEHKRGDETSPIARELSRAGRVLVNESVVLPVGGEGMAILGVDDPSEDRDRLDLAGRGLSGDLPTILLAHSPEIVTRLHRRPVDLVICGHTHGGQVCPPNGQALWTQTQTLERSSLGYGTFGPRDFARFTSRDLQRTRMFVSRGVGTAKMAVRVFCPPEVAVLTLRREAGAGT